jgi:hypothetical protein
LVRLPSSKDRPVAHVRRVSEIPEISTYMADRWIKTLLRPKKGAEKSYFTGRWNKAGERTVINRGPPGCRPVMIQRRTRRPRMFMRQRPEVKSSSATVWRETSAMLSSFGSRELCQPNSQVDGKPDTESNLNSSRRAEPY